MAARPEFMQSKMVAGIVAEALDQQSRRFDSAAVSKVLEVAAQELRAVHGIEAPAEPSTNGHATDYQMERALGVDTRAGDEE